MTQNNKIYYQVPYDRSPVGLAGSFAVDAAKLKAVDSG